MSDFDREAEREKLREKYEQDKKKREASERMSELLLQGATMTNRHCPECHSPVFRYEDKEFCPTCQKEVTEDGELRDAGTETDAQNEKMESADAEAADGETGARNEPEAEDETDPEATTARDEPEVEADTGGDESESEPRMDADRDSVQMSEPESDEEATSPPTPARERRPARVDPPARREETRGREERRRSVPEEGGDLREAEALLRDEILSLTRRAEETRDVGRKRDLLAAAKEAAETLEVVRRL